MALVPAPAKHLATVALAYVVCLGAAWATVRGLEGAHPIVRVAVADVVATCVMFGFSRAFDNSSFYDAYWSIFPMTLVPWLALGPSPGGDALRQVVVGAVVWRWGVRLTWNWVRSWEGFGHEDWRYLVFREQHGSRYWAFSFAAIHMFPTVCTFVSSLPLFPAMRAPEPFGPLDAVAATVALLGAGIESMSDATLRRYRQECAAKGIRGGICERGLWRWSRHPNYFGECLFWIGIWAMGVAAEPSAWWWTLPGPIVIVALFVFGTIPMMERRSLERRPEYAEQQRKVSMLVPWFRRD